MNHRNSAIARRHFLQQLGTAVAAASAGGVLLPTLGCGESNNSERLVPDAGTSPAAPDAKLFDRKLLFVFCAYGGASIIDSFLPIVDYESGDPALASTLNTFPDGLVERLPGSNLRSVKLLDNYAYYAKPSRAMGELVAHHGQDMAVITHDVSSVNHTVGQQRSLNGGGFDRGRTIMESVAMRHGLGMPLASCNMAIDGFVRHGADASVPQEARHELIMAPALFAAGTHGYRGVPNVPGEATLARARQIREQLDSESLFARTFKHDRRLATYLRGRRELSPTLEQAKLLEKLLLVNPAAIDAKFGVTPDPLTVALRSMLPAIDEDRMEAQVALGFLMAYHGVSTSVSMGLSTEPVIMPDGTIIGAPIAFDFSHNMHRVVQSLMWSRTASLVDALITLLKTHDYMGDPALGKMWDRSLVYIATEFGRDKTRPADSIAWGTGHNLNNGSVLISPLLKGNAVYGGVDPKTGLTYGFDPQTGTQDPARVMNESDVYSIIAQALDVEVPGAPRFSGVVRGA